MAYLCELGQSGRVSGGLSRVFGGLGGSLVDLDGTRPGPVEEQDFG